MSFTLPVLATSRPHPKGGYAIMFVGLQYGSKAHEWEPNTWNHYKRALHWIHGADWNFILGYQATVFRNG